MTHLSKIPTLIRIFGDYPHNADYTFLQLKSVKNYGFGREPKVISIGTFVDAPNFLV